ncbi:unnamed protein product [Angiostrongylus costaricensis]|uniref:Midasin n=1 Tax=Angiostrongylus costaricensis TaxID=334426 RepID=A0A158PM33_ANGCS|nr:unnamed protein product [Angiostrongylus costaricensis]
MCLYRAYPCDFDKPNEYGLRENVDPKDVSSPAVEEEAEEQDKLVQVEEEVTESDKGSTVVGFVHDPPESTEDGEEEFMTYETNVDADVEGAPSESKQESDTDESNFDADEESAPSGDYTGSTLTEEEKTVPDDSGSTLHQGIGNADAKKKLKQYSSAQAAENTGSAALTYSLPLIIILLTKHLLRSLFVEKVIII